jgi:hypothetical protein
MMDWEAKAKLALKLSSALHQAPDNPENFATVLQKVLRTNGLHITDVEISIGDSARRMNKELQAARLNAQPTFANLIDLAETKINLSRNAERALAMALSVPLGTIQERKRAGRVPRVWLQKIQALPDLDETTVQLDLELKKVVAILAENGYSPDAISDVFSRVRITRAGGRQIAAVVHGVTSGFSAADLSRVGDQLFGARVDGDRRLHVWVETQLRVDIDGLDGLNRVLNPRNVEKLQSRFDRELRMRQNDKAYARVALAAELIDRPRRWAKVDRGRNDRDPQGLRQRLQSIFGDGTDDGLSVRFAQLSGLDDRHTQDMLKGADGVTAAWWAFLSDVEKQLRASPVEVKPAGAAPNANSQLSFKLRSEPAVLPSGGTAAQAD